MQCMRAACVLASVRWIAKFLTFPLKIPHFQNFSTDRWVDCLIEQNDEHALTRWMACLWPIQCIRAACALVSVRWNAQFQTLPLKMPPPGAHFPKSCNGQVSQLLDATERWAHFDIVETMLVVYTMHVRCLCTCICPLDSINSDFSVENSPLGEKLGEFLCGNRWQIFVRSKIKKVISCKVAYTVYATLQLITFSRFYLQKLCQPIPRRGAP